MMYLSSTVQTLRLQVRVPSTTFLVISPINKSKCGVDCLQAVCSLETVATMQSNDAVKTTTVSATDRPADGATATTTGVVRCELAAAISNRTSTDIQLIFDVVHVEDVDVRGTVMLNFQDSAKCKLRPNRHLKFCLEAYFVPKVGLLLSYCQFINQSISQSISLFY